MNYIFIVGMGLIMLTNAVDDIGKRAADPFHQDEQQQTARFLMTSSVVHTTGPLYFTTAGA